jgi:hypothetical protein
MASEALYFVCVRVHNLCFQGALFCVVMDSILYGVRGPTLSCRGPNFVLSGVLTCVVRCPTLCCQGSFFVLSGVLLCVVEARALLFFVLSGAHLCVVRGSTLCCQGP